MTNETEIVDQLTKLEQTIGAYLEQIQRDMLTYGRAFEAIGHSLGELAVALGRRP